jgi:hypothetical protein
MLCRRAARSVFDQRTKGLGQRSAQAPQIGAQAGIWRAASVCFAWPWYLRVIVLVAWPSISCTIPGWTHFTWRGLSETVAEEVPVQARDPASLPESPHPRHAAAVTERIPVGLEPESVALALPRALPEVLADVLERPW